MSEKDPTDHYRVTITLRTASDSTVLVISHRIKQRSEYEAVAEAMRLIERKFLNRDSSSPLLVGRVRVKVENEWDNRDWGECL